MTKILGSSEWGIWWRAREAQWKLIPLAFLSVDWPYKLLAGSNGLITACYERQRSNWALYLVIWHHADTRPGQHTWEQRLVCTLTPTHTGQTIKKSTCNNTHDETNKTEVHLLKCELWSSKGSWGDFRGRKPDLFWHVAVKVANNLPHAMTKTLSSRSKISPHAHPVTMTSLLYLLDC